MIDFSGSFNGHARTVTVLTVNDVPGHELQVVEIGGPQVSTDEKFNAARVTYWALTDVVAGNGTQRGHYLNEHPDGSRNWGTFEGKVTTSGNETTVDGNWQMSDGTGMFKGVKGAGSFKTRMTSPADAVCTWQGRYELAARQAA